MTEFPEYMQKGSRGPCVTILQAFLAGSALSDERLVFDQHYGEVTASRVKFVQKVLGMTEVDGNFGPATRAAVKDRYHFDFEAACVNGLYGFTATEFIQLNGLPIYWPFLPAEFGGRGR